MPTQQSSLVFSTSGSWDEYSRSIAKHFEGLSLVPYICPAGYWTIGYGHLCDAHHPPIDGATANTYLEQDLQVAHAGMLRVIPKMRYESQQRQAAITDFVFNLGAGRLRASTLRRVIEADEWDRVPTELRRWVYGGGRKLNGLVARREAEILCLTS